MSKKEEIRKLDFTPRQYTYLAKGYYDCGLIDRAMECIDDATYLFDDIPSKYKDNEELSLCLQMRGCMLAQEGDREGSLAAFKHAKKINKVQENVIGYADCLIDEGTAWDSFSELGKAIRLRKKALKILKDRTDSDREKAKADYYLGLTYYKNHDNKKAEFYFTEALQYKDRMEVILYALGLVKYRQKKYDETIKYLLAALPAWEEKYRDMPYHRKLSEMYCLIGDVFYRMGLYVKAVKYYARAYQIIWVNMKTTGEDQPYRNICFKLYRTYQNLDETELAQKYADKLENL